MSLLLLLLLLPADVGHAKRSRQRENCGKLVSFDIPVKHQVACGFEHLTTHLPPQTSTFLALPRHPFSRKSLSFAFSGKWFPSPPDSACRVQPASQLPHHEHDQEQRLDKD